MQKRAGIVRLSNSRSNGRILKRRALQYTAFVLFSAYTGQRTMATMSHLTVGQFREALANEKPVLPVTAKQDKIRMEHDVPLHPTVAEALKLLFGEGKENEKLFSYNSIAMWMKREKIAGQS